MHYRKESNRMRNLAAQTPNNRLRVGMQKPEQLILLRKWIVLATAGGVYKYPLAAGIRQSGWFGWQKGSLGGGRKK